MKFRALWLAALACGAFLGAVPGAARAASWWNGDWQFRKEITLDASPKGADLAASVQEAPVLVRLSVANFSYFNDAKPDGSDFRAIDGDDKTPLKFHFERFDAQNQLAYLWVRLPTLAAAATTGKFFIYYGNKNAASAADPAGSWDNDATLVLEFSEPDGKPADLTAYRNNPSASTAEAVPASLIGGGAKFAGSQSVTVPATASLRLLPNQGFTASAWVKLDAAQPQAYVLALEDGAKELVLGLSGAKAYARYAAGGPPVTVTQAGSDLALAAWHLLAVTVGAGQLTLYVDGAAAGTAAVRAEEIGGALTIGGSARGGNFLSGELDQLQVSKVARSADWIRAAAKSQGIDAPLVVYGADGQKESSQGSYFVTIAKNLTVDGWVVIVICLMMLVVALIIMFMKALYLSRVEAANRAFVRDFHELSGDTRALDQSLSDEQAEFAERSPLMASLVGEQGKYGASTVFALYHIAVKELDKRVGGASAGAKRASVLSSQSIEAIRAALDATSTRLQQRLSARMVLLTIAISGGPFLGLLGTVIGVMITFAAIAASGDVNVNAIAPGTAAALAATVAGLAVAIPCLFGYNWLNTRIKAITADNRVFVDEFVAKIAEQYS